MNGLPSRQGSTPHQVKGSGSEVIDNSFNGCRKGRWYETGQPSMHPVARVQYDAQSDVHRCSQCTTDSRQTLYFSPVTKKNGTFCTEDIAVSQSHLPNKE